MRHHYRVTRGRGRLPLVPGAGTDNLALLEVLVVDRIEVRPELLGHVDTILIV